MYIIPWKGQINVVYPLKKTRSHRMSTPSNPTSGWLISAWKAHQERNHHGRAQPVVKRDVSPLVLRRCFDLENWEERTKQLFQNQ